MIQELTTPEVRRFIRENESADEKQLVLRYSKIHGVPSALIAQQLVGQRKAKEKIPTFYHTDNIIYPPQVNLEQCSSELTAAHKNEIIKNELDYRTRAVDLTGGFGVDAFFLRKIFQHVDYVEQNYSLKEIAEHNYQQLQVNNITCHTTTGDSFLQRITGAVNLIYIDPSRRTKGNQKVFRLQDCEPNVATLQNLIFEKTTWLLIKTSPLLDIHQGLKEIEGVKKVFVVSVENECKEILFLCRKDFSGEPVIHAVELIRNGTKNSFRFRYSEEQNSNVKYGLPQRFLYEPSASLLKAGAFRLVASRFGLLKLHVNTHFYTNNVLYHDFPGRVFEIESFLKSDPKSILNFFPDRKANIITRNYPLSAEQLKKKLKLKDGGGKYLIAGTSEGGKFLCTAIRVKKQG